MRIPPRKPQKGLGLRKAKGLYAPDYDIDEYNGEIAIKHMAHPDKMLISGRAFSEKCIQSGFEMFPVYDRHVYGLEMLT